MNSVAIILHSDLKVSTDSRISNLKNTLSKLELVFSKENVFFVCCSEEKKEIERLGFGIKVFTNEDELLGNYIVLLETFILNDFYLRNILCFLPINSCAIRKSIEIGNIEKCFSVDVGNSNLIYPVGFLYFTSIMFRELCNKVLNSTDGIYKILRDFCFSQEVYMVDIDSSSGVKKIKGGSFANVQKVSFIQKQASGVGEQKLRDETRWLMNLPEEGKFLFPQVESTKEEAGVFYTYIKYYDYPSLRDLIFSGAVTSVQVINLLDRILSAFFEKLYLKEKIDVPANFVKKYHFERVWHRLKKMGRMASVFEEYLKSPKLFVNGRELFNIPGLICILESRLNDFSPPFLSKFAHSDLHFENILVSETLDDFKVIDPRGYEACDYFYDFGKLSHSTNGLYDLIHEGYFDLVDRVDAGVPFFDFKFQNSELLKFYNELNSRVYELFEKYSKHDQNRKLALFNEVMHFCSDVPFHISRVDLNQKISKGIYVKAVELINDFVHEFYPEELEDYEAYHTEGIKLLSKGGPWELSGDQKKG